MPGSWDPQVYRERAEQWRAQADKMPPGESRDACLTISDGYVKLAALIEQDRSDQNTRPPTAP